MAVNTLRASVAYEFPAIRLIVVGGNTCMMLSTTTLIVSFPRFDLSQSCQQAIAFLSTYTQPAGTA